LREKLRARNVEECTMITSTNTEERATMRNGRGLGFRGKKGVPIFRVGKTKIRGFTEDRITEFYRNLSCIRNRNQDNLEESPKCQSNKDNESPLKSLRALILR
jgi:hypothetical protein